MTELSANEQRYLMAAFAVSPIEWFLPRRMDPQGFSSVESDRIVEALDRAGLMQGQPDRYARLTDQGRKEAAQLCKLSKRNWPKFYKRRKVRIAIAASLVGVWVSLLILKWAAVL